MKFTVSSNELLLRLQTMSKVIDDKVSLPILSNILFSVSGSNLLLTAANSESRMTSQLEIQNEEGQDGSFCIPCGKITEYIKHLPDQPLTFAIDMQTFGLELTCMSARSKQVCTSADAYPVEDTNEERNNAFGITEEGLLNGISSTLFATGNDEIRPVMNGIFFDIEAGGKLSFVATEGHLLARYIRKDVNTGDFTGSFVLNKKPANILRSLLSKTEAPVKICYGTQTVVFETLTYRYTSRLVEGNYPPYKSVIPANNEFKLIVNRQDILGAITRAGIFVDSSHLIRFELYSNSVQLEAQDTDFSCSAQETVPCQYDGVEMTIGFNGHFLAGALSNIDAQEVVIEISEPNKPSLLHSTENNDVEEMSVVALPMKVV